MNEREKLIAYSVKYHGNYNKILNAYNKNEYIEMDVSSYQAITLIDDLYPDKLKELENPPLVLFYKGNIKLLNNDAVAIVGSRNISDYGKRVTKRITNELRKKYTLVSGMAIGVDACVHRESFNYSTIAVLGCGIDYIYPRSNKDIYWYLSKHHLIISEYPEDTKPEKYYFPFRNRIIAALGKSLIVTQAKKKSGTMHTVNEALTLCRDIYVVPYMIDDYYGDGCNELIQQGANILLAEDIKCL